MPLHEVWREVVALELQLHGLRVALERLALAGQLQSTVGQPPWASPAPMIGWGSQTAAPRPAQDDSARMPDWLRAYA